MWRLSDRGGDPAGTYTIPHDRGTLAVDLLWIDAECSLRLTDLQRRSSRVEAASTLVVAADQGLMREMAEAVDRLKRISPGWLKASVTCNGTRGSVGSGFSAHAQIVASSATAVIVDYQWNAAAPALVVAEVWSCGEHRHAGPPLVTGGALPFLAVVTSTLRALSTIAAPSDDKPTLVNGRCPLKPRAAA